MSKGGEVKGSSCAEVVIGRCGRREAGGAISALGGWKKRDKRRQRWDWGFGGVGDSKIGAGAQN